MQRNGEPIAARIVDTMKADIIGDVGHPIHAVRLGRLDFQRLGFSRPILWVVIDCFMQLPGQDLHDAVGIGVVVDGRAFPGVPYKEKLWQSAWNSMGTWHVSDGRAHNVRLMVDAFNRVPGIVLACVVVEILDPITRVRGVLLHQRDQVLGVDLFGRNAPRLTKVILDILYEAIEVISLFEGLVRRAQALIDRGVCQEDG